MVTQTFCQQRLLAPLPTREGTSKRALTALAALSFMAVIGVTTAASAQDAPPPEAEKAQGSEPPAAPTPSATPASASASEPSGAPAPTPRAHHAPIAVAKPNEPLSIEVLLEHPELIRSAVIVYKPSNGPTRAVPLQRGVSSAYVAVIPGTAVVAPSIGYTIEIERVDGVRLSAFASRAEMHPVQVIEDRTDARERALLSRLDNRRSVVSAGGEYAQFGLTRGDYAVCPGDTFDCDPSLQKTPEASEEFWRVELSYTYRPLRTVAEFSLRGGVVRGRSLVGGTLDESKYKVGLNYGAPSVRFRFADAWHSDFELLISITEQGFAFGAGNSLIIGDPYGSNLRIGFETIGFNSQSYFGSRFFSRMDIAATDRVIVSPIIEITDMPHSEHFGVRLLCEAAFAVGGGFSVSARGGYQARDSSSGGIGLGGKLSLAF